MTDIALFKVKRKGISAELKAAVWAKTGHRCWYCGKAMNAKAGGHLKTSLDHRVPHSKGGEDTYENLFLACQPCNGAKHRYSLEEFRQALPLHIQARLENSLPTLLSCLAWSGWERDEELTRQLQNLMVTLGTLSLSFYGESLETEWSHYSI